RNRGCARSLAGDRQERMDLRPRVALPRARTSRATTCGPGLVTLSEADAIFLELARIDPESRASFLDQRCGNNGALRRDVESLISLLDAPHEDFLDPEHIPTLDMATLDGPLQPGTSLGSFLVLRALGSGGMGVVYAAQQDRPRRTVAIKVLRRGYRHP